jgi:putative endonuclease
VEQLVARRAHIRRLADRGSKGLSWSKKMIDKIYTTYALYSPNHERIYIGYTGNLQSRLLSHNELGKKGWTIKYRPWELAYSEEFATKKEAMRREKELKSARGRQFIWQVIEKSMK